MKKLLLFIFILFNFSIAYALMKDPTQPLQSNENSQDPLVVSAIIISNHAKTAIINGELVKEGDVVGGMRIIKIESNKVEIEQDNVKTQLYLVKDIIKQDLH